MPDKTTLPPEKLLEIRKAANTLSNEFDNLTDEQRLQLYEIIGQNATAQSPDTPLGWKSTTTAPYYKEKFARNLKVILDDMYQEDLECGGDKLRCQDRFVGSRQYRISANTLNMRFSQAFLYLVHFMDTPDKKYKQMREDIEIGKEDNKGVRLRWKDKTRVAIVEATRVDDKGSMVWKQQLEDFLETASEGMLLQLCNKALSKDNLKYISGSLMGIKGFHILKLETNNVKILRTDIEEEEVK